METEDEIIDLKRYWNVYWFCAVNFQELPIKILEKFPKSKYSDALKEMIDYVIERDY